MTGDQWFGLGLAAIGVVAVIGGVLTGAYVNRKAREQAARLESFDLARYRDSET